VCIRIWCPFVIDCKKVHPSICLMFGIGNRAWPRPFFPGWIAFQNFLLADLELGRKKVRGEKKSGSKLRKMGPDL
jgi:hypothetical protein